MKRLPTSALTAVLVIAVVVVAAGCGGSPMPWEKLDDALVQSDIVLSTTGAPEPIVSRRWFDERVLARPHPDDAIPALLQIAANELPDGRLVLDQEDRPCHARTMVGA